MSDASPMAGKRRIRPVPLDKDLATANANYIDALHRLSDLRASTAQETNRSDYRSVQSVMDAAGTPTASLEIQQQRIDDVVNS